VKLNYSNGDIKIDWQIYNTERRHAIREKIEQTRSLIGKLTAESKESPVQHLLNAMVDAADHIFAGIIALSNNIEALSSSNYTQLLLITRFVLTEIEKQVRRVEPNRDEITMHAELLSHFSKTLDGLARRVAEQNSRALRELAQAFASSTNESVVGKTGGPVHRDVIPRWDEIRFSRHIILHAVRVAIAVLVSYMIMTYYNLAYSYWATMSTVVVMRPHATNTWLRVVERVLGSVSGGILAALLMFAFNSPLELLVLIFPLAAATIAFRAVNYSLFVFFLTPLFVIITDMLGIGLGHGYDIATARIFNNVLGGAIGLACCLFIWPDSEPKGLRKTIASAIEANMHYATLSFEEKPLQLDAIYDARRAAGIASNNAEITLRRMIMDGLRRRAHLNDAEHLLFALRHLAGIATVA
jgi:uncharacterized membrane protein YccC